MRKDFHLHSLKLFDARIVSIQSIGTETREDVSCGTKQGWMYLVMVIATMRKGKPMDDLISRQAAITQLSHNKNKGDDEWGLAVQNDIQTIWKLPTAQPEQQWIPCSETVDITDYMVYMSFEEAKEILKKSIDETTNINEALEKAVEFI